MNYKGFLLFLIILGFFISTVNSDPISTSDQKNSLKNTSPLKINLSPVSPVDKNVDGNTLQDGFGIIQNQNTVASSLKDMESRSGLLSKESIEADKNNEKLKLTDYYGWVRSDPSHTLQYQLVITNGFRSGNTMGILGYSDTSKLITGADKYQLISGKVGGNGDPTKVIGDCGSYNKMIGDTGDPTKVIGDCGSYNKMIGDTGDPTKVIGDCGSYQVDISPADNKLILKYYLGDTLQEKKSLDIKVGDGIFYNSNGDSCTILRLKKWPE